jgi:acyl-CoA synthetase (NDP forming)
MQHVGKEDLATLKAHACPLLGHAQLTVVPEPFVKAFLERAGLQIPRGVLISGADDIERRAAQLRAPLVLKAYGSEIIHKSELGAVRLDLAHQHLLVAIAEMASKLKSTGVAPAGYWLEEQQAPGIELVIGAVARPSGVVSITLGLGGIYVEVLKSFATRVLPLTRTMTAQLVEAFPGSKVLDGFRGHASVDRRELIEAIHTLAGEGGVIEQLIPIGLREFECNPVIVSRDGIAIADARLVLCSTRSSEPPLRRPDFDKLFKPRSIAVAGASRRGGFGVANRALATYRAIGWKEGLYALHPEESQIDGIPAYRSLSEVPGRYVDYLKVVVPAAAVSSVIRENAAHVGIIQVVSSGFGEMGEDGRALEKELLDTVRQNDVRMVGPNCIGAYCPAGRQAFRTGDSMVCGGVGLVSQSGGVSADIIGVGTSRGLRFSKVLSVGNTLDISVAEALEYLVNDPETSVIGIYIECLRDGARLVSALNAAQGRKSVVILMGGLTRAGALSALSHTGSISNEADLLSAVCESTGATQVENIEQLVGGLLILQEYAQVHCEAPQSLLVLGSGGGATTLVADACEHSKLELPQFSPEAIEHLAQFDMGIPKILGNPLEVVIVSPKEIRETALKILSELRNVQRFSDVLVHINLSPFYAYGRENVSITPIIDVMRGFARLARAPWRIIIVMRNSDVAPPADLEEIRQASIQLELPLYRTVSEAAAAIYTLQRFSYARNEQLKADAGE